ncbi:MAG TPA: response regulator [Candidatus Obscuribacterales bacterium]
MSATIWFIDDDPISNLICMAMTKKMQVPPAVKSHVSAAAALTELENSDAWPSLIFLDLNMPGCDGWEFLERFHRIAQQKATKVVVLSSSIQENDVHRAETDPAVHAYLSKPLNWEDLQSLNLEPTARLAS